MDDDDMGEFWRDVKKANQERRQRNLEKNNPTRWVIHTDYHWSRMLNGKKLDYWPSKNKWQYEGKIKRGNINEFIARREK